MYVCTYVCACNYGYVCIRVCGCVSVNLFMCASVCVHVSVCVSVCVHVPVCVVVGCRRPPIPAHGSTQGVFYHSGARVTFHCDLGFQLRGPRSAVCLLDGTWSASDSQCGNLATVSSSSSSSDLPNGP